MKFMFTCKPVQECFMNLIHNLQKLETIQLFFNKRMDEQTVYIYSTKYQSGIIKKNELLRHTATWMNLECITLKILHTA